MENLTNDVAYTFQLRAANTDGAGTAAEAGPVTPKAGFCGRTEEVRNKIMRQSPVNSVSDCADVTTTQLAGVTGFSLKNEGIRSLQPDDFSRLTALRSLDLGGNGLSSLPGGVFSGLTALQTLDLGGNTEDPLPLTVTLERNPDAVETRAVVLAAAPFSVPLTVSVANGGLAGGAATITVPAGARESAWVGVTRTDETTAVTVDIDLTTQPSRPPNHRGYTFVKSTSDLPLTVVQGQGFREGDTDLPANATTNGVLVADGLAVRGTINEPVFVKRGYSFDTDWFAVELEAGRTYRIDMKGAILVGPGTYADNELTLRLPQINAIYDADGGFLLNTFSRDESSSHHLFRVTFHAHAGGTYYIAASGESFEWGSYELRVIDITRDADD